MDYITHQVNCAENSQSDYNERGKTAGRPEPKRR